MQDIVLNQVGFLPEMQKTAIFRGGCADNEFEVVDALCGTVIFTGKIGEERYDTYSGENVRCGDLSPLAAEGCYFIRTSSGGRSYCFKIAEDIYSDLMTDSIRMMYMQRCGTELDHKHAGIFAHKPCHMGKAYLYGTDICTDVSGGWHDAGDYGRYTVAAALTAAEMMIAYRVYPQLFSDDTRIPESGNGIPDILDEVRYGLDWLFKMQDSSGGVYHKVTYPICENICTARLFFLRAHSPAVRLFSSAISAYRLCLLRNRKDKNGHRTNASRGEFHAFRNAEVRCAGTAFLLRLFHSPARPR